MAGRIAWNFSEVLGISEFFHKTTAILRALEEIFQINNLKNSYAR